MLSAEATNEKGGERRAEQKMKSEMTWDGGNLKETCQIVKENGIKLKWNKIEMQEMNDTKVENMIRKTFRIE